MSSNPLLVFVLLNYIQINVTSWRMIKYLKGYSIKLTKVKAILLK